MLAQSLQCPECESNKVWKDGLRNTPFGKVQRFVCRVCGFRFSDPEYSGKNNIRTNKQKPSRQICVSLTEGTKNLTAKPKTKVLQETKTIESLINFSWWLIKNGRAEQTAKSYTGILKVLAKKKRLKRH